jgi:DNA-binding HxlR family transcriptional regulator
VSIPKSTGRCHSTKRLPLRNAGQKSRNRSSNRERFLILRLMQRNSWADANCPMARSVDLIGEWGSLLILREAFGGVRRFDDFQKKLGISRNLLTTRLKKLVEGGVLERRPIASDAKRHEYALTEKGEDLFTVIIALRQWGDRWLFPRDRYPADMFDNRDQSPLAPLEVRSEKGRKVILANLTLKAHHPGKRAQAKASPSKKRRS